MVTRGPSPRDVALAAAWRSFIDRGLPVGNIHDLMWAALVHGYDAGVASSAGAEPMSTTQIDLEDDGRDMNPLAPAWENTQGTIEGEKAAEAAEVEG